MSVAIKVVHECCRAIPGRGGVLSCVGGGKSEDAVTTINSRVRSQVNI